MEVPVVRFLPDRLFRTIYKAWSNRGSRNRTELAARARMGECVAASVNQDQSAAATCQPTIRAAETS